MDQNVCLRPRCPPQWEAEPSSLLGAVGNTESPHWQSVLKVPRSPFLPRHLPDFPWALGLVSSHWALPPDT